MSFENSHKTAIKRNRLSAPMQWLKSNMRINPQRMILDYGCGRGDDVNLLRNLYNITGYDPHYFPEQPQGKYDVIVCTYVLNVVSEETQKEILKQIDSLADVFGDIYITVRRDIKTDTETQRVVKEIEGFKSIHKTNSYEIFHKPT